MALRAEVSWASILMVSLRPFASTWTRDLDVVGFLVSGLSAVSNVTARPSEASSRRIVALLLILSLLRHVGECCSQPDFSFLERL